MGRGKVTEAQTRAQVEMIAKKISQGYTDSEIMAEIRLGRSQFYRYKAKMYQMFGNVAAKKTQESIEFEAEVLKDRLIRLHRTLEAAMLREGAELADIAQAAAVGMEIAINVFKLECEGLRVRQSQVLRLNGEKANQLIGDLQRGLPEPDITPVSKDTSNSESTSDDRDQPGETTNQVFE